MDTDIQFGELEQAAPQLRLRPDRNKHFAVAAYDSPHENDLPIFVDLDVMRDMELHALSDTSVELGGVMLGGQYEDEGGRPFVLVTDSLRAEHYESTKGSFKFTHDTWAEITRQRDEFPADLQMVGWYHTHPDWGVFLSGMDMFICDNFFNKPLDVALVIDPCRQDRGLFQWTKDPAQRIRRTGGFYLVASRFRQAELEFYAAQLQGGIKMTDPRFGSGHQGPYAAPVVNINDSSSKWQGVAVLGMLTMQFLLLALIAWRMLATPTAPVPVADSAARDIARQRELLDEVIGKVDVAPEGVVSALADARDESRSLEASNLGLMARIDEMQVLQQRTLDEQAKLAEQLKNVQKSRENLAERNKSQREEIADLSARLAQFEDRDEDTEGTQSAPFWNWTWIGIGVAAIAIVAVAVGVGITMRKHQEEEPGGGEIGADDSAETPRAGETSI